MKRFDVVIIGAGQAAIPLAYELASKGRQVAIAERKHMGGSCVNFGCTPSKAVIASARLAYQIRRAAQYGLQVQDFKVDFKAVMDRARAIVAESRDGLRDDIGKVFNPSLLKGHARFVGGGAGSWLMEIDGSKVEASIVVLDTGTRAQIADIDWLEKLDYITSGNWIDQSELPDRIAIVGGGVISLEMAQFYARMGSSVTIIESGPRVAGQEDDEVSEAIAECLAAEDIETKTGWKIAKVEGQVKVVADKGEIVADALFVATGRKPNTDDLGLDKVGVELDEKGIVKVDDRLKTTAEGIFAVGDIRGGPQFTHTSWDDFRILKSQLLGDGSRTTKRIVPYAIFTDPQLGRVGITENQAKKEGMGFRVGRYEMKHNGRAREEGLRDGFVKVLVESGSERLLGAAVFAAEGAEMIQPLVDLMNSNLPISAFRDSVVTHPTFNEATQSALEAAK